MKKILAVLLAALLLLSLAACGESKEAKPAEAAETAEAKTDESQIANPWKDAESAQDAAEKAEVGYFTLPEKDTETTGGPIGWHSYRYMEHLAQADGAIGAAEMTVRKGLKQESKDVSGDYTEYKFKWTQDIGFWNVTCFGNEEGRCMKAIWLSDNFSYSIVIRGQGDLRDTYGVDAEALAVLVNAIQ
jgi:predicted small lipoprotein YifL